MPRLRRPPPLPPLPPRQLRLALQKSLADAERVAVLGVGSELRGDDAVGLVVAERLATAWKRSRRAAALIGYTAPENFTGPLVRHLRDGAEGRRHLVIVDAADLGLKPGAMVLLDASRIAGVTFSTHQLPLALLVDYILRILPVQVHVVAVQPASTAFGRPVSRAVRGAATRLAAALRAAV